MGKAASQAGILPVVQQRDPAQRQRPVGPVRRAARRRRSGSPAAAGRPRCRSAARARPSARGPGRSMSSVSPILVNVSSSICLRMSAGSTNRSALGRGDAEQGERGQAGAAGAHRMDGHHRLGRGAVARVDREHRAALTIGPDRLEQPGYRGGAVGLPGGVRIRLAAVPDRCFRPRCSWRGRRQLDELRAEQILRLARQDLRRVPVVLDDAPVVVDPEDQGPNGRGHGRMRALGGARLPAEVSGVSAIPASWKFVPVLGSVASLGPVARSPRQRGTVRSRHRSRNARPRERCPSPTCRMSRAVS